MASDPATQPGAGKLEVGRIAKPHGIRGEVIVHLVTNRPEQRLAPGAVLSSESGDLKVAAARSHQSRWIVSFVGVTDRNEAERLRGTVLTAERLETDADSDVLWVHDLIGAEVVDTLGHVHGRVESVEANPASDLLVLAGGHLVPLTFMVERTTDGSVIIDPPAGLLDD